MLNALCVKPIDYKSIALPTELQGLKFYKYKRIYISIIFSSTLFFL